MHLPVSGIERRWEEERPSRPSEQQEPMPRRATVCLRAAGRLASQPRDAVGM